MKYFKSIIVIGGIIMYYFILGGCFKKNKENELNKINIENTKCFTFSYSVGNYMNAAYIYTLEKIENDKYIVTYQGDGMSNKLEKEISEDKVLELENILKENEIYKWNGFDKSDNNVLDGHDFSLYYKNNNQTISASGYMMYPDGYKNFKTIIDTFYSELFKEEIEKQKTTE